MAKGNSYQGITPDRKNANKGTERGRYMVEASLRETGAGRSIVLDKDGRIIAGNKTFEAASDIGLPIRIVETDGRELVAVKRTDLDLDDDTGTARKLAYFDNRAGQVGLEWDASVLLGDLTAGLDLSAMFRQEELDELLADLTPKTTGDTEPQTDRAEELRQKWQTSAGQLWLLDSGKGHPHRLICGDCTDAATVARVMGGERAALVFTDPPYNVASEGTNFAADAPTQKKTYEALKNAEWDHDFDIRTVFPVLESIMADDCAVYVCTSHWLAHEIWCWMRSWSKFCFYVVWCKPNPAPSLAKRHWTWATELIPYGVRGRHVANFPQDGHALSWWAIVSPSHTTDHPTEKPVEVPTRAIEFSSNSGAVVFDGFSGSGTTIIACENLGRRCRACEISAAYTAVALQRFLDHTGIEPRLLE